MLMRKKSCSILVAVSSGLVCLLTIIHIEQKVDFQRQFQMSSTDVPQHKILYSNQTKGLMRKVLNNRVLQTLSSPNDTSQANRIYANVKTFLMFIGYPRSGTTIVGSILDAHPHIVVAHEYNLGKKWLRLEPNLKTRKYVFHELIKNSENESLSGQRSKGYKAIFNYHVPGLWQGKFKDHIQIIGDKKGGATTRVLSDLEGTYINDLQRSLHLPVKMIHVIRNPFDNIATMAMRLLEVRGRAVSNPSFKINNDQVLADRIKMYFSLVHANYKIRKKYGSLILDVKYSKLVRNPRKAVKKICHFLNVTCDNDYLNACSRKIFAQETKTRKHFHWPKELRKKVYDMMGRYSFLKGFTF